MALSLLFAVLFGSLHAVNAARSPLYDNSRNPVVNEDFARLSAAGYRFTPEGRVLKPETGEPLEAVEMPRVLDELEGRQRLQAMLQLNLIFSRFGYKDLPPEQLEEVRRIGRRNWNLLSRSLRGDLKGYFGGAELEAMDKGVSIIRVPRSWSDEMPEPEGATPPPSENEKSPTISDLPPDARPPSIEDVLPVTALPAPWGPSGGGAPAAPPVAAPPPQVAAPRPRVAAPRPQVAPPPPQVAPTPPQVAAATPAAPPREAPVAKPVPLATPAPAARPAAAAPAAPAPASTAAQQPATPVRSATEGLPTIIIAPGAKAPNDKQVADLLSMLKTGMGPPPTAGPAAPPPAPAPQPPSPAQPAPAPQVGTAAPQVGTAAPQVGAAAPQVGAAAPQVGAAASPVRPSFVEYPTLAPDGFAKFLAEAPYGREAHHLLGLLARYAEPEDRRIALGVVQRHLPAVLMDAGRAGTGLRANAILPPGDLGVSKVIVVLHTGPVLAKRKRLLMGSQLAFVPDSADFYRERSLAVPTLDATALNAASASEEEGDWGRVRVFDDGSRRLKPTPEQLAGTLLEQLLLLDARARGWEDAYHSHLRARSAHLRLYRRLAAQTGSAPRLDRALAAEYTEWLTRPLDWLDHWAQALSAPAEAELAPSLTGDLEERLRARGAAELAILARIGLAPDRETPAKPAGPDDYVERERQARIDRELKTLSTPGPEARAWIAAERRFRLELSNDAR